MSTPARITVFRTPVIGHIVGWIARALLRLRGWTLHLDVPPGERRVLVVAPHTSYWDAPILLGAGAALRIDVHWMGTHNLFRWPLRSLMRWLGGIPVDRTRRNGLVDSAIEAFAETDRLQLAIAPEGTRYRVDRWKSGFHRIARGAGVPISLIYADYRHKRAGISGTFTPSGDLEADMAHIRAFYADIEPRHPERWAPPAA